MSSTDLFLNKPTPSQLGEKGRVATLGMFIIDRFEVTDPDGQKRQTEEEAIGGGGVYAMIAARMFLSPSHVGLVVDKGTDFPPAFENKLSVLGEGVYWRAREGGTTRALNVYSGSEVGEGHQSFRYLTPSLQIHLSDLVCPPSPWAQDRPEWVHVVVRYPRAHAIVAERDAIARGEVEGVVSSWKPKMIWEPLDVQGGERIGVDEWCRLAVNFEVISPNLLELQHILHLNHDTQQDTTAQTESAATRLHSLLEPLAQSSGRTIPTIVLRAGKYGSYTISPTWKGWTPAYWQEEEQGRVVDPTGGGNGFLGGFAAGMILSGDDARFATICGSAAASFMIQQRGLPVYGLSGQDGVGGRWNGDDPWARARDIAARMQEP